MDSIWFVYPCLWKREAHKHLALCAGVRELVVIQEHLFNFRHLLRQLEERENSFEISLFSFCFSFLTLSFSLFLFFQYELNIDSSNLNIIFIFSFQLFKPWAFSHSGSFLNGKQLSVTLCISHFGNFHNGSQPCVCYNCVWLCVQSYSGPVKDSHSEFIWNSYFFCNRNFQYQSLVMDKTVEQFKSDFNLI